MRATILLALSLLFVGCTGRAPVRELLRQAEATVAEAPDSALHLFTVRGVVAFLVLFGWGGLCLCQAGVPGFLAVFLAIPIGFAGMVGIALAVREVLRLQYDGTLDLRNAVGLTGQVYLTVPPARTGEGKVTVSVPEQLRELDARTDFPAPIPTGSPVRVSGLAGRDTLLVEPISDPGDGAPEKPDVK